jgi:hypothetical protein
MIFLSARARGYLAAAALTSFALTLLALADPPGARAAETQALVNSVLPRAEALGVVQTVEATPAKLGDAQVALDPQAHPEMASGSLPGGKLQEVAGPSTAVTLVVFHGSFVDTLAKVPRYAAAPSGSVLAYAVSETGSVIETYVGDHGPPSSLGEPAYQARISTKAQAARARTARIAHRRLRAKAATWGNKCSAGEGHHCYALATWEMTGSEQVKGSETEENTASVNVPGWGSGDFVDNEEWVGFFNGPNPYWTEMGQTAGGYTRCCSMEWFYAYQNHSGYHENKVSERWEIPFNEWAHYYMDSEEGAGVWCYAVGPAGELRVTCIGGFETYSKSLEDGTEIAANTGPSNAAKTVANATWTNGTVHTWNKAVNGLYNEGGAKVTTNGMCVSQYTPVNAPGNIYSGSAGNCP